MTSTVPALFETATSAPQPECIRTPMTARFIGDLSANVLRRVYLEALGGESKLPCETRTPVLGRRWSGRNRRMVTGIYQVFQFFAGFEEWNFLGGDFDTVARLWIAANTRLALPGAKAAKAADFDLVAHAKRAHDAFEDGLDDDFTILPRQLREAGDFIDQISFCHIDRKSTRLNCSH